MSKTVVLHIPTGLLVAFESTLSKKRLHTYICTLAMTEGHCTLYFSGTCSKCPWFNFDYKNPEYLYYKLE